MKTTTPVGRRVSSVGESPRSGPPPHPAKSIWRVGGSTTGPVLSADDSFYEHRPTGGGNVTDLRFETNAAVYVRRIANGETL